MKTKIFAVAALALMAAACQKNGGEAPQPSPINKTIDLATVTGDTTVGDGFTLTGTLGGNYKISIADGATVTLDNVVINGVDDAQYDWAGLTCEGNATVILNGTNSVQAFGTSNPGIYVPGDKEDADKNKTLTIQGEGSLTASGSGGAGIGGGAGDNGSCGNIVIKSGTIEAQGYFYAAGIGSGANGSCGDISIEGGLVTARGDESAAGIGCGNQAVCGNITISGAVVVAQGDGEGAGIGSSYQGTCGNITVEGTTIWVKATKGDQGEYTIGAGKEGACGTVTFDGTVGDTKESPYYYPLHTINLGYVTENTVAKYNYVLTGTLKGNYKISIANEAEVTLDNVTINGTNDAKYPWAGITCEGTANIYLKGENHVKGFYKGFPGIYVPTKKTLGISIRSEDGTLYASNNGDAAGIGAGKGMACGHINITGGTIYADGGKTGWGGAGIGGCYEADCGEISIVNLLADCFIYANGGKGSAGIGGGQNAKCSSIMIADAVLFGGRKMKLAVTKGDQADYSIGAGKDGTCGLLAVVGSAEPITESPFIYRSSELLATINSNENTDFLSGTKNFGNAILSISDGTNVNDGSNNGWHNGHELGYTLLTVGAAEGYTVTRIEFDIKDQAECRMTKPTQDGKFLIYVTSTSTYNCVIRDGTPSPDGAAYGECGPYCIRVYGYKNEE